MKLNAVLLLFVLNGIIFSQYSNIEADLNLIMTDSLLSSSQIAVDIYDLTAKEIVYRKNNNLLMHPASNMKILSSAAGLYFLGPDYEFTTGIWYDGAIDDSILTGDLYYVGGFDPDFTVEDLDSLSAEIREEGIAVINGDIIGDVTMMDSLFWGSGWMWDDDPSTDFPYLTPLIVNDAAVMVEYMPGNIGEPAVVRTIPESDYFEIENNSVTVTDSTRKFRITREWIDRSNRIIVEGHLDTSSTLDTTNLNLVYSTEYFLSLAEESLSRHGIQVKGGIKTAALPDTSELLVSHSRLYKDIIVNLNKESDNLSAEMTLRALSRQYSDKSASDTDGLKMIDSLLYIAGINPDEYRLSDGSGVSRYNLLTAELLTDLLKYFYYSQPELYPILKNSFPISGIDGTLEKRMEERPAYGQVYAKTGTLSGVSCLSGYIESESGSEFAFSIMIQNFLGSADKARDIQDKICDVLSEY